VHTVERDEGWLAFNSLTLDLFELDATDEAILERHREPRPVDGTDPAIGDLLDAGLLVSEAEPANAAVDRLAARRAARHRRGGGRFATLRLALTERCNMACGYCFQQALYPGQQPRLSVETLDATLEWFVGQAQQRPVTVQYFGGEPMLEWDLIVRADACLQAAVDTGRLPSFRQTMTTNGTLLNRSRAAWLVARGFDLTFSFDGPPDVNDQQRVFKSGRGTYAKAAQGLREWVAAGGDSAILMTATRSNVVHLPEYVRWFVEESGLAPTTVGLNSPQPTPDGWETGGVELARAVFSVWRYCDARGITFHGPGTYIPEQIRARVPQADNCVDGDLLDAGGGGSWPVYVSAEGRRSMCLVHHRDHRLLPAEGEDPVATGERWHRTHDPVRECDGCIASQICGGPCTLERLLWGGRLSADRCGFMREMTQLVLRHG
jgi:uncharacterized protein